jgi:hypothetical protein
VALFQLKHCRYFYLYGAYIVRHALPHYTNNAAERRAFIRHPPHILEARCLALCRF